MAPTRAVATQVKAVASAILAADQPQVTTLTGWLSAWGAGVPPEDTSGDASDGSAAGDGAASPTSGDGQTGEDPGLLDGEVVIELGNGSGRAWDAQFLQAMLTFQDGEIRIANAELAAGVNVGARALARRIVGADMAQLVRIRHLLAG